MTDHQNPASDRALPREPVFSAGRDGSSKAVKDDLETACAAAETIKARLAEIKATFESSNRSYLDRSKLALEYRDKYLVLFPQVEEKKKRGRPGIVKKMALALAVPGETPKAREIWLTRALKIAGLSPDVIEAAKEAKLDRNQGALLKIAKGDADSQLQIIKEIEEAKFEKPVSRRLERGKAKVTVVCPGDRASEVRELLIQFAQSHGLEVVP